MPLRVTKMQRFPTTDRNEFALAAVQACRTIRAHPKIQSSQYFWADSGNTVVFVTQGEPGCFDQEAVATPEAISAAFALHDLGNTISTETWADAGPGQKQWQEAGSPSGT